MAKQRKGTRPDSPRRALAVMAEKAEACLVSLKEAIGYVEEGDYDEAIAAIGEAERSLDGVSTTWLQNVVIALKDAETDRDKILERMNR